MLPLPFFICQYPPFFFLSLSLENLGRVFHFSVLKESRMREKENKNWVNEDVGIKEGRNEIKPTFRKVKTPVIYVMAAK